MKTIIIKQKQSNSGSIHDLSSEHFDREIKFKKGDEYAVVLAAYHGGNVFYTCRSKESLLKRIKKEREFSYKIIDNMGNTISGDGNGNFWVEDCYEPYPIGNQFF
jgi:hypothetical protein